MNTRPIDPSRPVVVIGAGTMGHGIAQVAAAAGFTVRLTDARPEALDAAMVRIADNLNGAVIASIGPVASATLRDNGIAVDIEPSHPKMGFLVKEVSEQSQLLLAAKRQDVMPSK